MRYGVVFHFAELIISPSVCLLINCETFLSETKNFPEVHLTCNRESKVEAAIKGRCLTAINKCERCVRT